MLEAPMKPALLIAVLFTALPLAAAAQIATIEVTPASGTIGAGKTLVPGGLLTLLSTPLTEDDEPVLNQTPAYRSSAPKVATVDAGGVVTGHGVGEATITSTVTGVEGTLVVRVIANPVSRLDVVGA